jgi:hypothetical protein
MHEFKELLIDDALKIINIYSEERDEPLKICLKCNLIILTHRSAHYSRFWFNNIEIYDDFEDFEQIDLTCEELIIKSIVE